MSDIEDQGSFRASEGTMLERMAWRMAYEWAAADLQEKDARLLGAWLAASKRTAAFVAGRSRRKS